MIKKKAYVLVIIIMLSYLINLIFKKYVLYN